MYFQAASMLSAARSNPTRNVLTSVVSSTTIQYRPALFITELNRMVSANPENSA